MSHERAVLLGLVVVALATVACGGKVPQTTVWSLKNRPNSAQHARSDGPALGVRSFTSAAELRTTKLVWREGESHEIKRYPYDEWVSFPDRMLEDIALAALTGSSAFSTVSSAPPTKGLDAVLACRLLEFTEWDEPGGTITARVSLRWSITDAEERVLGGGILQEEAPASAKSARAVVDAFHQAVEAAVEQLVQEAVEATAGVEG